MSGVAVLALALVVVWAATIETRAHIYRAEVREWLAQHEDDCLSAYRSAAAGIPEPRRVRTGR